MKEKIFVSTSSFAEFSKEPLQLLELAGFEYSMNPHNRKLNANEIQDLVKDAVGLVAGTERLDGIVLESLPRLKVISRCGVGTDNVDLEIAKKMGIQVCNTPDAPTEAVAELTIGLIFDLLRKISLMDRDIRNGKWKKHMGDIVSNRCVGVIGFGRIGKKTAQLLKAFGCEVAYYDSYVTEGYLSIPRMTLKELCRWADIITIHISSAKRFIGAEEMSMMKQGAWLVNTSRGGVVDEEQLAIHLRNGHLAGAALDVFEVEPYNGPLCGLDNVVLTPHIGSYARDARINMEVMAVKNLLNAFGVAVK